MAFPNIDATKPYGTYRVSTIDDHERETRRWLIQCMQEISGYPDSSALKISVWTTATRPDDPVAGVFGYNATTGQFEYFNGSSWQNLTPSLPEIYEKARRDANGNIIHETYATKTELTTFENSVNAAIDGIDGRLTKLKIW